MRGAKKRFFTFFYHPDFTRCQLPKYYVGVGNGATVGTGISPVREHMLFADFTAGGELHPAPKKIQLYLCYITNDNQMQAFQIIFIINCKKSRAKISAQGGFTPPLARPNLPNPFGLLSVHAEILVRLKIWKKFTDSPLTTFSFAMQKKKCELSPLHRRLSELPLRPLPFCRAYWSRQSEYLRSKSLSFCRS